jgi:isoleucyl-tRNA synthetase
MAEKAQKTDVGKREEDILAFWDEHKIFEKSVERHAPHGDYVFYDGPPFATGLPHYGHIVASVIKDAVPRYWTMRGYRVPRVWGWDCHGLPIENIVEKELGFKHKKDIKNYGIAKFNERCREEVLRFAHEWEKIIPRIGRWADMKNAYRTMDKPFMESVWWVFKQVYDKGLVYEDYRSMHICPRCETTLSQTEVSEGYKDVKDIAVTVKFKLKYPESIGLQGDVYMLAWTTTPWTLPGNVALAVGADIEYAAFQFSKDTDSLRHSGQGSNEIIYGDTYIAAKESLGKIATAHHKVNSKTLHGRDLFGLEYEPPFDYYVNDKNLKNHQNGWKVYTADFVHAGEGTGIAHEAPAFGADDWELLKRENLPFVQHVNYDGTMKPEVKDFTGKDITLRAKNNPEEVREIDLEIRKFLGDKIFDSEKITHSYPHCWRCDTALLNYATSSWFVNILKLKENLLDNAKKVNWSPENIKEGRFGKWLEGARDWSISRQRFWASVIPIWRCEKCKKEKVFGNVADLETASGKKIDDLHKHIVDEITFACECGGTMQRIPDVLDTWFDSGSMPYGSQHYPFENKEQFDAVFPAQFIAEGLDQTRAWFYYLHVLAGGVFGTNAFQNVIVNGIVLAEDGKKMSKKLKNYPDPMDVVEKYGADALRLYLLSSPVMQAENLDFSEKGVDDVVKKNVGRLANVLAFYKLYEDGTPRDFKSTNILDQWIVARLAALIAESTAGYENYKLDSATRPLPLFIDDLSVWYLRRSRDRFKEDGDDKKAALATLRYVLHTLARVMAPSMPFFAEYLFQAVREGEDEESVHLTMWPEMPQLNFDAAKLLAGMFAARLIVSNALKAREAQGVPVRQQLSLLQISKINLLEPQELEALRNVIADEVNAVKVEIDDDLDQNAFAIKWDFELTEELLEKGFVRELMRNIQERRKKIGLRPGDSIELGFVCDQTVEGIISRNETALKKALKADNIKVDSTNYSNFQISRLGEYEEIKVGEHMLYIAVAAVK